MRVTARGVGAVLAPIVLLALLAMAIGGIDLERLGVALRTARLGWIALSLICYAAILPLWALQWRVIAPRSAHNTFPRMMGLAAIMSTMHNTAPMFAGEVSGVVLLIRRIGMSRTAALSVLAMDQLLVGLAKLTVLAAASALVTLPVWMNRGILTLLAGVAALLAATLGAAWYHAHIGTSLAPRLAEALEQLGTSLAPLRSPIRGGSALAIALAKKAAEILAILAVQRSFGVELPLAASVLTLAVLNLSTMLPLVPGNVGVFEGAIVFTYTRFGLAPELALGMALVQHACYFASLALPGYAWLAASRAAWSAPAAL